MHGPPSTRKRQIEIVLWQRQQYNSPDQSNKNTTIFSTPLLVFPLLLVLGYRGPLGLQGQQQHQHHGAETPRFHRSLCWLLLLAYILLDLLAATLLAKAPQEDEHQPS